MSKQSLRVGMLGCGVVGGATAQILLDHSEELEERCGIPIELVRVAIRSTSKPRSVTLPNRLWTTDPWDVVGDHSIDVVVKAIGGIEPARDLILAALKSGKHVVTANKELLSSLGRELMETAEAAGVDLLFEAA